MSGRADGTAETASSTKHRLLDAVRDHPWALAMAGGALAVAYWAAFVQPAVSPAWYGPIMVSYAALAVGFVYLDEFSSIRLTGG